MEPLIFIAELQANPQSIAAYRGLVKYYKSCNRTNEAQAFEELIENVQKSMAKSQTSSEDLRKDKA